MINKSVLGFKTLVILLLSLSFMGRAQAISPIFIIPSLEQECPEGTVAQFVGIGFAFGGMFFDSIGSEGEGEGLIVEQCVEGGSNDALLSQVTRRTNQVVAQHLLSEMTAVFSGNLADSGNKMAASSDLNSYLPDGVWAVTNITEISNDQGTHADTDIYQIVAGFDKVIGDFIVGAALTYAHNEDEQGSTHTTGDTVGITPYVAYKITDYLFASTLLGYNYTHTNADNNGSDLDTNEFISETNLNVFKVIDSFLVKGRAGIRYKHTHTTLENAAAGRDGDFDELTWLGDIEFGYQVSNKMRVYTGLLYEYRDQEQSAASALIHDGVGFMRYGAEYSVNKALKLGASIEHDLNDEDNDFITGGFNARLEF